MKSLVAGWFMFFSVFLAADLVLGMEFSLWCAAAIGLAVGVLQGAINDVFDG